MFKLRQWKNVFTHTEKKKVPVRVGAGLVQFTDTQAGRLRELTEYRRRNRKPDQPNALEKSRYTLKEAAFRLLVSEDQLLQKAVFGSVGLYVGAGDLQGRWRHKAADGRLLQSSVQTLRSGFLALTSKSCRELADTGGSNVSVLELRCPSDPSAIDLECEVMAALSAWGDGRKIFCLREPLRVDRKTIILLAPLAAIT